MIKAATVTTTALPSVLYTPPGSPSGQGVQVTVVNEDATNAVRIGGPGITTAQGLLVAKASSVTIWLDGSPLYVVPVAGTPLVSYFTTA